MSGHSHWSTIKHKKAGTDAKRGKLFSKLARAIIVAAKNGGGDPEMNLKLRYAIDKARAVSMPRDNIERAIKRGTGELASAALEEVQYEGYGPGGVAMLVEVLTDNRNRTAGELRKMFEVHGGKLGEAGCVSWMFERKGLFVVEAKIDEDRLFEIVVEAGADDLRRVQGDYEITCNPTVFQAVRAALADNGLTLKVAELSQVPTATKDVDAAAGKKVLGLMEALDEHEDVQNVYSNFNMPDEVMAAMAGA